MPLFESRVTGNAEVADEYFQMDFTWPDDLPRPQPGEFFTIRIADSPVPLLRRPFGFSECRGGSASMIYWRRGPGTAALAARAPGEKISVMGPLGHGFPLPPEDTVPVLIAGGVGIGPIVYLANELARAGRACLLLIGARHKRLLPRIAMERHVQVRRATDDGSVGFHGNVIGLLEQTVDVTSGNLVFYLCGPDRMLRAGHACAAAHGIPAWVSMEQMMGCGVGACMGCAVRVAGEAQYARVCTEGPVFRSEEIVWT